MSVPRDTVVLTGNGGIMKINSVYAGGGADGMARLSKRLGAMLGFELDGYVLVNLEAFRETVDLVDGVEFDVPQDMYYQDPTQNLHIDLKAGKQLLDGEKGHGACALPQGLRVAGYPAHEGAAGVFAGACQEGPERIEPHENQGIC